MKNSKLKIKGFTLVELLVVIAVLGVLAAVLLVTINPLEQINKGKDAGAIDRAKQIIGAAERYYVSTQIATTPACSALETAGELISGGCTLTGYPFTIAGTLGTYTVAFTPLSTTYKTKCVAGSTCIVPSEVQ